MPTHLVLLCAGTTAALRAARFPDPCAPLDDGGRAAVRRLVLDGRSADRCAVAPGLAARETAALLALRGHETPALADIDAGPWAGRRMEAVDSQALADWLAAPADGVPGGESMAAVMARVGSWMDALAAGSVLAVTHGAAIRAAIAHALDMPVAATLGIDVTPLMRVTLSRHGRWRVQELRRA